MVRLAHHVGDDERHDAAHQQEEHGGGDRGAGSDVQASGDQRDAGCGDDHQRRENHAELGDAEVELTLEDRQADQQGAECDGDEDRAEPGRESLALLRHGNLGLTVQQDDAGGGESRAADQHQVGRAPEGHVLAEEAVPHVVEREADQRIQATGGDEDAADRGVPRAGDLDRGDAGLLTVSREDDGGHAGDEECEESVEDQVVRRVGERSGVAAAAGVEADVPHEAEQGDDQGAADEDRRDGGPARLAVLDAEAVTELLEPVDAVGPVGPRNDQQDRGDEAGSDAQADDLTKLGAARRRGDGL